MLKKLLGRAVAASTGVAALLTVAAHASADVWRVVYELAGTQFDIRDSPLGLGDGTYPIGPGYLVIDYPANNGSLVDGAVQMRGFSLVEDFVASNPGANVVADLFAEANFSGAQTVASGTLAAGTLTWNESFPYKVVGTNTCTGNFCGLAGFTAGVPRDDSDEYPVTFAAFTFGSGGPQGGASFEAGDTLLQSTEQAKSYLLLEGREIRRELIDPSKLDGCLPFPYFGAHVADRNCDGSMSLAELLRVVQLFNAGQFHCALGTEDSYQVGPGTTGSCVPHTADYEEPFFRLTLTELLRSIQLFNLGSFAPCENKDGDDGFCVSN